MVPKVCVCVWGGGHFVPAPPPSASGSTSALVGRTEEDRTVSGEGSTGRTDGLAEPPETSRSRREQQERLSAFSSSGHFQN